ncbi:Tuftelin-interacting protein 11 [Rhizoctonia solani]|uniref:Tuftelin-interacting protein 11 n=1 Tax=Rhizoctonia solani TaxID=456999 RepID=A0A8H8NRM8_9AGAM|nr:Tuftelin-interacting protein 11 [Rhizoctonia solani]QRW17181.1 Tuftelin-interacting protein 11 [Rhizoctonia solani]
MARRKRFLEDDSSDDSEIDDEYSDPNEDPDERAERLLHQDPYQRGKRRRRGRGKESATYGVFGESEDEDPKAGKRADITKAPAFVSSKPTVLETEAIPDIPVAVAKAGSSDDDDDDDGDDDGGEDAEDASESDSASDSSDPIRPASPHLHTREPSDEPADKPVGLGGGGQAAFRAMFAQSGEPSSSSSLGGIGARGGIGAKGGIGARGGIGSGGTGASTPAEDEAPRSQRSFVRTEAPPPVQRAELTGTEKQHFAKISGGFGARMLASMGWEAGTGLGANRQGIITPIESKLRPQKAGIAYKGFSEKTDQSKREAKRKAKMEGKAVSSDEDEPSMGKKKKSKAKFGDDHREGAEKPAWKRPKKSKIRVEHKTYEEIVRDAGVDTATAGVGQIIDATGAVLREVGSITEISGWAPTSDTTRLLEIRHNIRMIVDLAKGDLDGLAREGRAINERKKWVDNEEKRLRGKVSEEADLIARLQRVHLVVDEISAKAKAISQEPEPGSKLEEFTPYFDQLLMEYSGEYERYRLDEIVVASIAPALRRVMAEWDPLRDPTAFTDIFRRWKKAFRLKQPSESTALITGDLMASTTGVSNQTQMTPYESLLWTVWLPRVRSSINNMWSATEPDSALALFDGWRDLLPPFIHDNVLDQLIIPKIQKAVSEWNPKNAAQSLQAIVFPWLSHVGLRMEDLVGDAKRKVRSSLRGWKVGDGLPKDLIPWKDIFGTKDWDNVLLKYIVPKLSSTLREDFAVNPRSQDLGPLHAVLEWAGIIRDSIIARVLEAEFFGKWLSTLHVWLTSKKPNFDEIVEWYQFWKKKVFPEHLLEHSSVASGFERGLQLMNSAMALGPNAAAKLPKPDLTRDPLTPGTTVGGKSKVANGTVRPQPSHTADVSFRTIVDEFAAAHNLLLMPTQRTHERSRMPLYRVSNNASGKGGILVYLLDDVVWTGEADDWKPVSLEEMVLRATKKQ